MEDSMSPVENFEKTAGEFSDDFFGVNQKFVEKFLDNSMNEYLMKALEKFIKKTPEVSV